MSIGQGSLLLKCLKANATMNKKNSNHKLKNKSKLLNAQTPKRPIV